MGHITVSLPDDLQAQLDSYAQQHNQAVSAVVADAVRAFLGGIPQPTPVPAPTSPLPGESAAEVVDEKVRRYLEHLVKDLQMMLETVTDLSNMPGFPPPNKPPYELREPPWVKPPDD